jgi:2-hydroxychromene-2-carboxylate isomerase
MFPLNEKESKVGCVTAVTLFCRSPISGVHFVLVAEGRAVAVIDFWYSIGSTYTYLSVMRLTDVSQSVGVAFRWRPFNVRHIMVEQNNIPFKDKPVKAAYMWRDVERRAHQYGLSPKIPAPYPLPGLVLANQIAVLGAAEGWVESYTRSAYKHWFEGGEPPGEEPNITASLIEAEQDPEVVLNLAQSAPIVAALSAATDEAKAIGIFGSPTFVVAGEVFWGDDRLDDAVRWANR